jgi:hypothetical protein
MHAYKNQSFTLKTLTFENLQIPEKQTQIT